jgi:hypothetical protein
VIRWGAREERLMLSVALPESAVSAVVAGKPSPSRVEQFQDTEGLVYVKVR